MKGRILTIVVCLAAGTVAYGQDVHFSQYDNAHLYLNPGLAGMGRGYNNASFIFRMQQAPARDAYKSQYFGIDMPILWDRAAWKRGYLAWGLSFIADQAGKNTIITNRPDLTISGVLKTGENSKLSLGLQAGYVFRSFDAANIEWDSQYNGRYHDPSLPSGESVMDGSANFFDLGFGLAYRHVFPFDNIHARVKSRFNAGLAVAHVLEPDMGLVGPEKLPMKITGHFDGLFHLPVTHMAIVPSGMYLMQGPYSEIIGGAGFQYFFDMNTKYTGFIKESWARLELKYRLNDAWLAALYVRTNNLTFGFSYDWTTAGCGTPLSTMGGLEFSLIFSDLEGDLFNQGSKHVIYRRSVGGF